ncbi:hypothetical protein Pa4123_83830 [Phytohabitans aurantiacus]|uniref:Uncharacterized protein n=1 Tax=Phytohabitans aurantiacus TaxID=3016789 RepID=A0ABQ5R8X0_9ACTN|nr:hypothetical protein Pa4123_83830 [Phytohabitans aurantiacus]
MNVVAARDAGCGGRWWRSVRDPAPPIKGIRMDQGRMHAELRSNRVYLPLIGVHGVATRRAGLAWGADVRGEEIQPRAFALDRRQGSGAWRHAVMGGRWRRGRGRAGWVAPSFAHLWVARRARASWSTGGTGRAGQVGDADRAGEAGRDVRAGSGRGG